jgi:hypothetical protein
MRWVLGWGVPHMGSQLVHWSRSQAGWLAGIMVVTRCVCVQTPSIVWQPHASMPPILGIGMRLYWHWLPNGPLGRPT